MKIFLGIAGLQVSKQAIEIFSRDYELWDDEDITAYHTLKFPFLKLTRAKRIVDYYIRLLCFYYLCIVHI